MFIKGINSFSNKWHSNPYFFLMKLQLPQHDFTLTHYIPQLIINTVNPISKFSPHWIPLPYHINNNYRVYNYIIIIIPLIRMVMIYLSARTFITLITTALVTTKLFRKITSLNFVIICQNLFYSFQKCIDR